MIQQPSNGPYRPVTWSLGGKPKKSVDIPITSVFLVLYMIGAATHMTIFQLNRRRGHKFLFNAVFFGFCMSRIATTSLRIASTCIPNNISLALAAAIFVAAATLIIFVINLMWSQRVLRSLHPHIGWNKYVSLIFNALYAITFFTLVIVITATIQSYFTLRPRTRTIDRSLQLYASTYLAILSFLPILIVAFALALPRKGPHDKFGHGKFRVKIAILLAGSFIISAGAWYRCGTSWKKPVPMSRPLPEYFNKACFYIFNFGVEVMVVYLYAIARVDLRFHIPNGAKGPGSYAGTTTKLGEQDNDGSMTDEEKGEAPYASEPRGHETA